MSTVKIIAGLGNPGTKYELTRHNIGFLITDYLIDHFKATTEPSKNSGEIFKTTLGENKIFIVKPQTFMNLSGNCIAPLFRFYQCAPEDLIVIHDEIDLNSMTVRFKKGGGTGGHNGIRSIDEKIGHENQEYFRMRVGIGRDARIPVDRYVLQNFSEEEIAHLNIFIEHTPEMIQLLLQNKLKEAMNAYHGKEF